MGDKAQALEEAGKNNDLDRIRADHDAFMADYLSFKEPLSGIFSDEEEKSNKPEAEPELMTEVFSELNKAADDMDCDRLQTIITEMEEYRIPDKDAALWKKLKDAVENYDYSYILELLDGEGNS